MTSSRPITSHLSSVRQSGYVSALMSPHPSRLRDGYGNEGCRRNVRTFIKRIRTKFHDVDPGFEHIRNCAGLGYRWCAESPFVDNALALEALG
jgi:hypothetical protein